MAEVDRDGVGEEVGADVGSAALGPWMRAPKGNSLSEQRAVSVWIVSPQLSLLLE